MIVIGIDPGLSGALVALKKSDWSVLGCTRMPVAPDLGKSIVDAHAFREFVASWQEQDDVHAVIERVHAMPTDGSTQAFSFGMAYGSALTILSVMGVPHTKVTPQAWKKGSGTAKGPGAIEGLPENPTDEEKKAHKSRVSAAKRKAKDIARGRAIELWPAWDKLRTVEAGQAFADAALIARFGGVQ